ncbi:MAG: hypothetical protein ACR2KK_14565 [Acidimicrobiales bacterium]
MRRTQAMAVLGAVLGGVLLFVAPPASAQTGYPPGLCTTVTGTQNVGEVSIGQRFVLQLAPTCLFTPGAAVTVAVNGVDIPGKTAEPGGFVLVDITVVSATQLSIDDSVLTPAFCGTNTVTARGPSATAQGGIATQTATFTITCPITPAGPVGPAGPAVATPIQALLSLTGANSLRFVAVALALVVTGSMAMVVTRRRRADRTA